MNDVIQEAQDVGAIVLAAGRGTRMKSDLPKVLHDVAGRPMIDWVLAAVRAAGISDVCLISSQDLLSSDYLKAAMSRDDHLRVVTQTNRLGTADAVAAAADCFLPLPGTPRPGYSAGQVIRGPRLACRHVLICAGDTPALDPVELRRFIETTVSSDAGISVLGMEVADPTGYGRIVQRSGQVVAIVEEREADEEIKRIRLCNSGVICGRVPNLFHLLSEIDNDNDKGEYYLTDCFRHATRLGVKTSFCIAKDPTRFGGVNDQNQRAALERVLKRLHDHHDYKEGS